jgi:HAD domain in Swiss Army Knife RNA repair proteins
MSTPIIIALDFDGILHPNDLYDKSPFCIAPQLWKILRAIPTANVVFSTSWRDSYDFDNMLDFVTAGGGEDLVHRFIGNTPNLEAEGHYGRRDLEIQQWLDNHHHTGTWLAIDDMAELFPVGHPNLYLVDGDCGLTDADVLAIMRRLS